MPIKNYYNFPSSHTEKRVFKIEKLRGVDYNPYHLDISGQNAVDIFNLIFRDGINQKRYGFEELVVAEPFIYHVKQNDGTYIEKTSPSQINGVWSFVAEDNREHTVLHIGNLLWEINDFNDNTTFLEITITPIVNSVLELGKTYIVGTELSNQRTQAFVGSKRLYILGGNDIFVLRFLEGNVRELVSMSEYDEVYIPTTTIGITYKDSAVAQRSPLDDINMMTQWRKNKLISGTYYDDGVSVRTTRFFDYELDASIKAKNENDLNDLEIIVEKLEINKEV
jgi:hypothetical protein